MKLTKNECTVLNFLLKNAKTPDAVIARDLKISLQAVRNIRKKLENQKVIKGYTSIIDYEKLGINVFAIVVYKVTSQAWAEFNEKSIEKWLMHPNVLKFYRIPNGGVTHMAHYGFGDLNEMNNFFRALQSKYSKYLEIVNMYAICGDNIIKDCDDSFICLELESKHSQAMPLTLKKD